MPALGDPGWNETLNGDLAALDAVAAVGGLCCTARETPSSSLNVTIAGGTLQTPWGQTVAFAGAGTQPVPPSSTTYVWLTTAGALTTGSAWPATAYVPIAIVTSGTTTITSIADVRRPCSTVVPIAQPTMGAATAGSTYTANEQSMIQTLWDNFRALGLGS